MTAVVVNIIRFVLHGNKNVYILVTGIAVKAVPYSLPDTLGKKVL